MPNLACVNGRFCPLEEATVSVEDRGFQFADGVYEVIVFRGSQPVMLEAHFQRLEHSCRRIRLAVDPKHLQLRELIHEGVRRAGFPDAMVYLQVTRGTAPRTHAFPDCPPTVVLTFRPRPQIDPQKRAGGLAVMTVRDDRWAHCDIKSIALLPNVLAKNEALSAGFDDALMMGPGGEAREATAANLFMIRDGRLVTQPTDETILPGITRILVLRCAAALDLPVEERTIKLDELLAAEEVFLSSTTIDILGVVRIDQHTIADGQPGPLTQQLYRQMLQVDVT